MSDETVTGKGDLSRREVGQFTSDLQKLRQLLRPWDGENLVFEAELEEAETRLKCELFVAKTYAADISHLAAQMLMATDLTQSQAPRTHAWLIADGWVGAIDGHMSPLSQKVSVKRTVALQMLRERNEYAGIFRTPSNMVHDLVEQDAMAAVLIDDYTQLDLARNEIHRGYYVTLRRGTNSVARGDGHRVEVEADPVKAILEKYEMFCEALKLPMEQAKRNLGAKLYQQKWVVEKSVELGLIQEGSDQWPTQEELDQTFGQLAAEIADDLSRQDALKLIDEAAAAPRPIPLGQDPTIGL